MPRIDKKAIEKAKGRVRQAERRERMRELGIPLTGAVDKSIVEALAFEMARTPMAVGAIPAAKLMKTARRILVRDGYDRDASQAAVVGRLSARPEHHSIDHIPSLHPDAGKPIEQRVRERQDRMLSALDI